jgi:hypothetical protein
MINRVSAAAARWLDEDPDLVSHQPLTRHMARYADVYDLD